MSVETELKQLIVKANECINSIERFDLICLKEKYQDPIIQKTLHLICILKGKAPTKRNAKELLNPLTFKLEFSKIESKTLRPESIIRAYKHLIINKDMLNDKNLRSNYPTIIKLLEWANCILIINKSNTKNIKQNGKVTPSMLPEIKVSL